MFYRVLLINPEESCSIYYQMMIFKCSGEFSFQTYVCFNESQKQWCKQDAVREEVQFKEQQLQESMVRKTRIHLKYGIKCAVKARALYPYLGHQVYPTLIKEYKLFGISCDASVKPLFSSLCSRDSLMSMDCFGVPWEAVLMKTSTTCQETKTKAHNSPSKPVLDGENFPMSAVQHWTLE